ncbi:hypothetical protein YC2023_052503 [Brassica napus]
MTPGETIALCSASIKGATAFEVSVVRKVSIEFIGFDTILLSQGLLWTAFRKDYPEPFSLGQSQYCDQAVGWSQGTHSLSEPYSPSSKHHLGRGEETTEGEEMVSWFSSWASKHCPDAKHMNVGSDTQLRQLFFGGITNRTHKGVLIDGHVLRLYHSSTLHAVYTPTNQALSNTSLL